jgi:hypothetical protein
MNFSKTWKRLLAARELRQTLQLKDQAVIVRLDPYSADEPSVRVVMTIPLQKG